MSCVKYVVNYVCKGASKGELFLSPYFWELEISVVFLLTFLVDVPCKYWKLPSVETLVVHKYFVCGLT